MVTMWIIISYWKWVGHISIQTLLCILAYFESLWPAYGVIRTLDHLEFDPTRISLTLLISWCFWFSILDLVTNASAMWMILFRMKIQFEWSSSRDGMVNSSYSTISSQALMQCYTRVMGWSNIKPDSVQW
jgi:hypothetical protein